MSKQFIYNNNHTWARTFGPNGKRKGRMVKRDFSGYKATVCDYSGCGKEIHGEVPYSIEIQGSTEDNSLVKVSTLHGEKFIEPIGWEVKTQEGIKKTFIEIELSTQGRSRIDFCHTCLGKMEDFSQKLKARIQNGTCK